MTRKKLNFYVLGLGLLFMALNAAFKVVVTDYHVTQPVWVGTMCLIGAAPVAAAFYLIKRTVKALSPDEYQQQLIARQTLSASLSTLMFMAIIGFWDSSIGLFEGANSSYTRYIFFWFLIWFLSGFRKQYSE